MLKGTLFLILMTVAWQTPVYIPSDEGSSVKFKIKNLGVAVSGSFTGVTGKITFDPANPAGSMFETSIDAASINTGIDMRDDHLKQEEYFDVKNYPRIQFVSTKVSSSGRGFTVTGNLTIKNVTKEISFPFTATARDNGYLFGGEFKINRRDFKVGGNSITLSDNLTVLLTVFASKG